MRSRVVSGWVKRAVLGMFNVIRFSVAHWDPPFQRISSIGPLHGGVDVLWTVQMRYTVHNG